MTVEQLPTAVTKALGQERSNALVVAHNQMEGVVEAAPIEGQWTAMLHIPLKATTEPEARQELVARLRPFSNGVDWFMAIEITDTGGFSGMASDTFKVPDFISKDDVVRFSVFDLHSRLGAWWLAHLWRAGDLTDAVYSALRNWQIIPAAACSRALLEGAAAFVVEGDELIRIWDEYKQSGPHDVHDAHTFRGRFNELLSQAQLGTRIGEKSLTPPPLIRRSILTILDKFIKQHSHPQISTAYDSLCDAVHPSLGSGTVFIDFGAKHKSGATLQAHMVRRAIRDSGSPHNDPDVAWATADMLSLSVEHITRQAERIRWLLNDFGLTTGAAYSSSIPLIGTLVRPERNERCPCGSGYKAKSCHHQWGLTGAPP